MAKQKIPKDPAAPKRNLSAYLLFQNGMRNEFKARNPGMTFGQLSKYTSAMYAELTFEEKQAWQDRAESDKARYLQELSTYTPPPGYDNQGNFVLMAKYPVGSSQKKRDPNAPKRNLSSYLLYQNAMRDQFKRDNPGMTFGQLSKYTSHMYKSLTAEEKAAWDYRCEQDKLRFEDEMTRYIPPHGYDAQGSLLVEYKSFRKQHRKTKDPNAPKRARGSYVLFTGDYRPKILQENPGIKFVDLGRLLGENWRNLGPEEKKKYDLMSQQDKMRFASEMATYKNQVEADNASQMVEQHSMMLHQQQLNHHNTMIQQQQHHPQQPQASLMYNYQEMNMQAGLATHPYAHGLPEHENEQEDGSNVKLEASDYSNLGHV